MNKTIKKISIVIPVYNELNTLESILDKVQKAKIFGLEKEIVLSDDASKDGTKDLYPQIKEQYKNVKVILADKNHGKGAALRVGFEKATGDVIIIQDADLEYDPNEYESMLKPIIDNEADVVYGSRFLGNKPHRVLYFWHYVANVSLTLISNAFTNVNLSDMETCYKVFRKDVLKKFKLVQDRFGFEPEFTARVSKVKGIRIYEVGISYFGRTYEEGKKIGLKDAFQAIYCIVKYNLFD